MELSAFWAMTPWSLVGGYNVSEKHATFSSRAEVKMEVAYSSLNAGNNLPRFTVSTQKDILFLIPSELKIKSGTAKCFEILRVQYVRLRNNLVASH
jgi:hypothetical protein